MLHFLGKESSNFSPFDAPGYEAKSPAVDSDSCMLHSLPWGLSSPECRAGRTHGRELAPPPGREPRGSPGRQRLSDDCGHQTSVQEKRCTLELRQLSNV